MVKELSLAELNQDEEPVGVPQTVEDDDNSAEATYQYFMRVEPREGLGPIRMEYDKIFGRKTKVRDLMIGMTRNAKDENKMRVKAYLEPVPHTRINTAKPLQGWYKALHEPPKKRPRPCFTEAILTEPYGGFCSVGCKFCYINSGMRGYRGTGLITVPLNYGAQIREQLKKMRRAAAGYFSSFTDPFLPLESVYHNTQEAATEFVKLGLPIFFLSRLRYPLWARNLLKKNPHSYAQKSINTPDARDWHLLSPGAISLEEHLKEINQLHKQGIYISIQVNPVIAGVTTRKQIVKLFGMLKEAGTDHVIIKFVEAGYSWAPAMVERIVKCFGEKRGGKFKALFTDNIGGQRTISEEYRLKSHKIFREAADRLGLTYSVCYEYKYERNSDGTIKSKTGISIGRDFATSEQCHGQRVPVYTRDREEDVFEPVEECPPSGCLYCASENTEEPGVPRCGDKIAGDGRALRFVELKVPVTRESV